MPFTPLHMGPGILIKAILHGSFSLMVFGWAQIVMDIQPLIVLITGEGHLHGFSHTYIGATLLGIFSAVTGKYLGELGLIILRISSKQNPIKILWWVAIISSFIGTYSHVAIDSIMHSDMSPYYPFSDSNHLLRLISIELLHKLLVYTGIIGAVIYFCVSIFYKKTNP